MVNFKELLIARAIAKQPDLLVLDEPVQGVDFKGEITLYELIKKISEELNCGILLISHDLHVVMAATDFRGMFKWTRLLLRNTPSCC